MFFSFLNLYSTKTRMLHFLGLLLWNSQNSGSFSDAVKKLNKTKPNIFQKTLFSTYFKRRPLFSALSHFRCKPVTSEWDTVGKQFSRNDFCVHLVTIWRITLFDPASRSDATTSTPAVPLYIPFGSIAGTCHYMPHISFPHRNIFNPSSCFRKYGRCYSTKHIEVLA